MKDFLWQRWEDTRSVWNLGKGRELHWGQLFAVIILHLGIQIKWLAWFQVKDLARFKPMQRHLFLYDKMLLFCKRREETNDGHEKTPSYSFKHSLKVRQRCSLVRHKDKTSACWELNFSAVCSFLKPMIQFCCSSLCVSRWVLWGSQRTSKVTARSSKCGTMAERRFTSYRYDQASRTTHLTSNYSFHVRMIKNQIINSPGTSGSSSCGFPTKSKIFSELLDAFKMSSSVLFSPTCHECLRS